MKRTIPSLLGIILDHYPFHVRHTAEAVVNALLLSLEIAYFLRSISTIFPSPFLSLYTDT